MNKIPKVGMKVGRDPTREKHFSPLEQPKTPVGTGTYDKHTASSHGIENTFAKRTAKQPRRALNFRVRGMAKHVEG